ncbi:hypothetical protein RFI_31275, partial [Reticulomyxa filosa]
IKEIEKLKKDNARVLQLQDDLAEKDEVIQKVRKELEDLKFEREQWLAQKSEMESTVEEVRHQVSYLEGELTKSRSLATLPLEQLTLPNRNGEGGATPSRSSKIMEEEDEVVSVDSDDLSGGEDGKKVQLDESAKNGSEYQLSQKQRLMAEWRLELKEGDKIDVCDDSGLWWGATILETKSDSIRVKYEGCRIAVFRSKHAQKKEGRKVIKQGYLEKEGKVFRTWRRRFFVLMDDNLLKYYDNEKDDDAIGQIDIDPSIETKIVQFSKKKPYGYAFVLFFLFQLTSGGRTWKFVCTDEKEVKDWIHAINCVKQGLVQEKEEDTSIYLFYIFVFFWSSANVLLKPFVGWTKIQDKAKRSLYCCVFCRDFYFRFGICELGLYPSNNHVPLDLFTKKKSIFETTSKNAKISIFLLVQHFQISFYVLPLAQFFKLLKLVPVSLQKKMNI